MTMRTEILVLAEVENQLRSILETAILVVWDCPVNCDSRLRPDRIWCFNVSGKIVSLHLEIDENGDCHEDNDTRIAQIQENFDVKESWLVRYNSGPTRERDSSVRRVIRHGHPAIERSVGTEWDERIQMLVSTLQRIYDLIVAGISPSEDNWKTRLFFDT